MVRKCFIVPVYNHPWTVGNTVHMLLQFNLPIIVVNDGSDAQTTAVLQLLATECPTVDLVCHEVNQGKGGAVMTGLRRANELGYSHALQVDADGQHNLADIPHLWSLAEQQPTALISGSPVYDDSIPMGRKIGRWITHFWVWVETLSFSVKDTMCGFRVYPTATSVALFDRIALGKRMDFDIEVMVRLFWEGVHPVFVPTKVIYPPGGRSHFHALRDNWLITKMHTRLFFGMLLRLPTLLRRKKHRQSL
ncbi:MAG: glycosyltransferase family 2 protein [Rheinheimera sp.]|nr:MAG: glycosyltransferase family 2 protein [Rheinheimera sp.]